jgi:hypothetical protein
MMPFGQTTRLLVVSASVWSPDRIKWAIFEEICDTGASNVVSPSKANSGVLFRTSVPRYAHE